MTIPVTLPPEIEARITALASKAGQTSAVQLQRIIEQGLEDLEDYYDGQEVLGRIGRGEERVLSSEDFWRGVEN